jgi:transposase InsO family protein
LNPPRSKEQDRAEVFDYIERFYNPTRRHSTLGCIRPMEFEKAQEAQAGVHGTGSSPQSSFLW